MSNVFASYVCQLGPVHREIFSFISLADGAKGGSILQVLEDWVVESTEDCYTWLLLLDMQEKVLSLSSFDASKSLKIEARLV